MTLTYNLSHRNQIFYLDRDQVHDRAIRVHYLDNGVHDQTDNRDFLQDRDRDLPRNRPVYHCCLGDDELYH